MNTFIKDNFMLTNDYSERLFHEYAKDMPIIDYHCHLIPEEIASDKRFRSITEIWLDGDHYKWRAIRTAGYSEEEVTGWRGNPEYDEKRFLIWAKVLPLTIGNPLYHWTHLELLRYFDIDICLNENTAKEIYRECNKIISSPDFTTQKLIKKFQVKFIGTTDDPIDSLSHHKSLQNNDFECTIAPSWRPDKIININYSQEFTKYIKELENVSSIQIENLDALLEAIDSRIQYFKEMNCCISDHGLDEFVFTKDFSQQEVSDIFLKVLRGESVTKEEIVKYKSFILVFLGKKYVEYDMVMQLHIGALRRNNTKMFEQLGVDVGFDSINDKNYAMELSHFLDTLDKEDHLPKTIVYCLNPRDNDMLGAMIGNFQGGIPGKLQFGSGWWFNDQKDGMEKQIVSLANHSLLPLFVGMLTDSRSFLSFPRHEYFRRIICNIFGKWMKESLIPDDLDYIGKIVQNISYDNAKRYFDI